MSGTEFLFLLGLIANIDGTIDLIGKIVQRVKDIKDSINDLPKAFRDIQSTVLVLENCLRNTKRRIENKELDVNTCKALSPVVEGHRSRISELQTILDQCVPKDGSSRFARGFLAISTLGKDKKIDEIMKLVRQDIHLLHLTSFTSTSQVRYGIEDEDCQVKTVLTNTVHRENIGSSTAFELADQARHRPSAPDKESRQPQNITYRPQGEAAILEDTPSSLHYASVKHIQPDTDNQGINTTASSISNPSQTNTPQPETPPLNVNASTSVSMTVQQSVTEWAQWYFQTRAGAAVLLVWSIFIIIVKFGFKTSFVVAFGSATGILVAGTVLIPTVKDWLWGRPSRTRVVDPV